MNKVKKQNLIDNVKKQNLMDNAKKQNKEAQVYNPATHLFVKIDKEGKFASAKATPYKNVPLKTAKNKKNSVCDSK